MKIITSKLNVPEEEEEKGSSNWLNLPQDIFQCILSMLCLTDYLRFGSVCSSWRTYFLNAIESKYCTPKPQLPLLLLSPIEFGSNMNPCFFSLNKQEFLHPKIPLYAKTQRCVGSFECWLIMIDAALIDAIAVKKRRNQHNGIIHVNSNPSCSPYFFLNPVLGTRIALPSDFSLPQNQKGCFTFGFNKMVASSSPNDQNCIVAGIDEMRDFLAFCRVSRKPWTLIELELDDELLIADIEFHERKLYVLLNKGINLMIVYDFQDDEAIDGGLKAKILTLGGSQPAYDSLRYFRRGDNAVLRDASLHYLANDPVSEELLLIIRNVDDIVYAVNDVQIRRSTPFVREYVVPPQTRGFRVLKLVKSGDNGDAGTSHKWVELDNLGDRLVFVSKKGCKVISRVSDNCPEELSGRNCIYFTDISQCMRPYIYCENGMFLLNDKSVTLLAPALYQGDLAYSSCVWFTPNIW